MNEEEIYICPQTDCGRETSHVEEGYYECKCGWFGLPITESEDLKKEIKRLREQQQKILRIAETNMALEWGETDASVEWGYIIDMIKGWTE